jgi:ABC-type arginine/histidine transport system permease subunit
VLSPLPIIQALDVLRNDVVLLVKSTSLKW